MTANASIHLGIGLLTGELMKTSGSSKKIASRRKIEKARLNYCRSSVERQSANAACYG
jgi:hypothetical protein